MKRSISATIDDDLYKWILQELKDPSKYRNKSHLVEIALLGLRKRKP
ncbi:MAG: hypothetical protein ABIH34_01060 [Nanoarchaeota archaeon]